MSEGESSCLFNCFTNKNYNNDLESSGVIQINHDIAINYVTDIRTLQLIVFMHSIAIHTNAIYCNFYNRKKFIAISAYFFNKLQFHRNLVDL